MQDNHSNLEEQQRDEEPFQIEEGLSANVLNNMMEETLIRDSDGDSNVDSDEVIFYSKGNFMSRKGIKKESITHHPIGLSHGPQPGKIEKSIGTKETDEVAVMIDTYNPLYVTKYAERIDDSDYPFSWIDK